MHDQFNEEIINIRKTNPGIKIIAHPECPPMLSKLVILQGLPLV